MIKGFAIKKKTDITIPRNKYFFSYNKVSYLMTKGQSIEQYCGGGFDGFNEWTLMRPITVQCTFFAYITW